MADLVETARKLWERGRAQFPTLQLDVHEFTALSARHLEKAAGIGDVEKLYAADLFLVCACLARVPGALDKFEELHGDGLVRKAGAPNESPEEMKQAMLVKLSVPQREGAEPKLAEYSGRGPLGGFVRIAAARAAVDQHRAEQRTEPLGQSFADKAAFSTRDIEMSFLRGRHEEDFRIALHEAFLSIGVEDRMILRLHYREGLTASELAPLVKTSRATAHRRLQTARESLSASMRENLKKRLNLGAHELNSLLQLYGSRIVPALTAEIRQGLADSGQ